MVFLSAPLRILAFNSVFFISLAVIGAAGGTEEKARPRDVAAAPVAEIPKKETPGFGFVMSLDLLAQNDADLSNAEAAVLASQQALKRAQFLFLGTTSVSRQTVETAQRRASDDQAQLLLAQRQLSAAWGRNSPWRISSIRPALVAKLVSGDTALLRVTFPAGILSANFARSLMIRRLSGGDSAKRWAVTKLWAAPSDPTVPGQSIFGLVANARELAPGERIVGFFSNVAILTAERK